ncbi:MAG: sugar phosphate isomerase/epimerase [Phycisphaerales bacterium]|nr:sugar phosphate isomerase/epimerase [Phycisphaerales bacterium]
MIKLAFSSVACPERTLRDVAALGESVGAQGVELRTFGSASTHFACDPALSDPAKVAKLFADAGAQICCVATSCRFDEPIAPAVIGRLIADTEKEVRAAKYAIDLASELGAPYVRVFGFESPAGVSLSDTTKLVVERLVKVCDHARNRRVSVVIENGSAANGVTVLGDRLWIAKLKDFRGALPCAVGEGDMACHEAVRALVSARFNGWAVYEYDRAWLGGDTGQPVGSAMEMIRDSFATICRWMQEMGAGFGTGGRSPVRPVAVAS